MNIEVNGIGTSTSKAVLNLQDGVFVKKLMGEHRLVFSGVKFIQDINFKVGDSVEYNGEKYYINKEPNVRKINNYHYEYDLEFDGERHSLSRYLFSHLGDFEFTFAGSLETFIDLLVDKIQEHDVEWTFDLESIPNTYAVVNFDSNNILDALVMICEAFEVEWDIVGKNIIIKKTIGNPTTYSFQYGRGKGLYQVGIKRMEDKNIVTRVYARGGSKNITEEDGNRLKLDGFVENNVDIYGVRESVVTFDDIYPKRTGGVDLAEKISESSFSITDNEIDFDLNKQFVTGDVAKIVFTSGDLNGNEFEIISYNHSTKKIRYKVNIEESGYKIPNDTIKAEIGDTYTLVGISMPETYRTEALNLLTEKRLEHLMKYSSPRVEFDLFVDLIHYRNIGMNLKVGDVVNLLYPEKGINTNSRVLELSYPMDFPNVLRPNSEISAVVGDSVSYTFFDKIVNDIKDNTKEIVSVKKDSKEFNRRGVVTLKEFMSKVFDPDGNLAEATIQGIAGLFGNESMYFDLIPNPQMNIGATTFSIEGTTLIHRKYKIDGLNGVDNEWNVPAYSVSDLDETKPYYLSVKASKSDLTAEWILSETPFGVEDEVGYWHFNLGILSSFQEGQRDFRATKMFTLISGGSIETDTITAYLINVKRLFAQIIEVGSDGFTNAGISGLADNGNQSVRFWAGADAENRDTAPFYVLNDGSFKSVKGRVGGFNIDEATLRSENVDSGGTPTSPSSGIILSDWGVLSRNAGMSFLPATTGLDYSGSLVGEVSTPLPPEKEIFSSIRAGILGAVRQELSSEVLNQLKLVWGRYGGLFTSLKLIGAMYQPTRLDLGDADTMMTANDFFVAKGGSNTNVYLPNESVEVGRTVIVKNATGGLITVHGNGSQLYRVENTVGDNTTLDVGLTRVYRYSNGNQWIESDSG